MRRLLLVDDEKQLLDGLKKALRPWRDRWEVETALGGRAGLQALLTSRWDAIVCDARMPEVDGHAVLEFARKQQPTTVRLVLSGQVDARMAHALAAVSHQFLAKPSSADAVLAAVEECCRLRDTLVNERVREVVSSLGQLPVGPRVYHQLTELIDSPRASADAVADLLEEDVALTAAVLRFVSSAFFGLSRQVKGVREAVTILGMELVRELVLMSEVFQARDPLGIAGDVQRRGLFRARLARLVSEGSPMMNLAGEAALLSEIGVYVFALRKSQTYATLFARFRDGEAPLAVLEREHFGCSHAEVGAALLGLWGIPQVIVNAVSWHHSAPSPSASLDTRTVVALVSRLEEEALGVPCDEGPTSAELSQQLGVGARLPIFQSFARQRLGRQKEAA
ncbi:MAG: HDOD domain-containing protein [Myxococcota bacterium]